MLKLENLLIFTFFILNTASLRQNIMIRSQEVDFLRDLMDVYFRQIETNSLKIDEMHEISNKVENYLSSS